MPGQKCLKTKQAAAYLGLTPATMRRMRDMGIGPAYIQMEVGYENGLPAFGYLMEDLDAWVLAQRQEPIQAIKSRWLGEAQEPVA